MQNPLNLDYLVTLDYESYYDTKYSLRNLTYIEYINSPLYKMFGVSIQINESKPIWYHTQKSVSKALKEIPWHRAGLIGHNLHFDGLICAKKFGVSPKMYIDTLAIARGVLPTLKSHSLAFLADYLNLGVKDSTNLVNVKGIRNPSPQQITDLGIYCCDDVTLTWKLYEALVGYMPIDELHLVDATIRMQTEEQFDLDSNRLHEVIDEKLKEREQMLTNAGLDISTVRSSAKFAEHLRSLGTEPPKKISPRTGKETYAFAKTDLGMQKLQHDPTPEVKAAAQARLSCMSNLDIRRAERFIAIASCNEGKLPIPLNYYGAHTGRWSGGDKINPQNLTKKSGLRTCLMAPPGHKVLAADQSQIEARITAWLAEHTKLLNDFEAHDKGLSKYDVYEIMASQVYNVPLKAVTDDQRFVGKMCILGLGYGIGHQKLCDTLNQIRGPGSFELYDTKHMVDTYRSINRPVVELWRQLTRVLTRMARMQEGTFKILTFEPQSIGLPNGMYLQYPNLRATPNDYNGYDFDYEYKGDWQKIYGGRLTENIVQALARIVIADNMLQIGKEFPIATMTHDEIVIIPSIGRLDEAEELVTNVMTKPPSWAEDLPLALDIKIDDRYIKD